MYDNDGFIASAEGELLRYSSSLAQEFRIALASAQKLLKPGEVRAWVREGLAISGNASRSWEAAIEFFKVSPTMIEKVDFPLLLSWGEVGRDFSDFATAIAQSYFKSSPAVLSFVAPSELIVWARLGKRLYSDIWQTIPLCVRFFDASPTLLQYLTLSDLANFAVFLQTLSGPSTETALECVEAAQTAFPLLDSSEVDPFIKLGIAIVRQNWRFAKDYLSKGPRALARVSPADRPLFLAIASEMAQKAPKEAVTFLVEGPDLLSQISKDLQGEMLALAERISKPSPVAALEFLRICPSLIERMKPRELRDWVGIGISAAEENAEAGVAFFKLDSSRADSAERRVSKGVELGEVIDTLRLYIKALTGSNVALTSSRNLVERGIGWTSMEKPTTEGNAVFLPPYYDEFDARSENYEAYKVLATHQAAHLEFGTFDFSFEKPSGLFDDFRGELEKTLGVEAPSITGFGRFFNLFSNRRLAEDIFTVLEDARVDALVRSEYRGIRRGYDRVQQRSLAARPKVETLPLRQGILELLVQVSLDHTIAVSVPKDYAEQFGVPAGLLRRLQTAEASVEDSAEATIRIYDILRGVPNKILQKEDIITERLDDGAWSLMSAVVQTLPSKEFEKRPEDDSGFYIGPPPVDYRGVLKPELVQTIMKLRQDGAEKPGSTAGFAVPPETLKEILSKLADPELEALVEGNIDSTSGLFVSNVLKDGPQVKALKANTTKKKVAPKVHADEYEDMSGDDGTPSYFYDEWDFLADGYRPEWCRLKEQVLEEGDIEFFDRTLRDYAGLANDVKRQFQMLKPEQFKKIKRLRDGEEFDFDRVIESVVEKRAGQSPSDKLYTRRNKVERDIAVALLLDMSASTDDEIEEPELNDLDWWEDEWSFHPRMSRPSSPPTVRKRGKRIIDIEKESIVLLIRALETIGDRYGVYGFSGHGRDNVEFFVVKELDERFDDRIKRRIDKISPSKGTRMGPAIRHAINKLANLDAKVRLLILLSDGRPQDHDYGHDRTEKEYAIKDTKMALLEAKQRSIIPFCLTVDKSGQDYLQTMMGDMGYEVVSDIKSLPKRLPSLYRRLTT